MPLRMESKVSVTQIDIVGIDAVRAKRPQYVPTVLTKQEVIAVIQQCDGIYQLVVKLLYGSGFRWIEGLRLRVKDVEFDLHPCLASRVRGVQSPLDS
jgi:integrase